MPICSSTDEPQQRDLQKVPLHAPHMCVHVVYMLVNYVACR